MRFVTFDELRELVDMGSMSPDLLATGFKIANDGNGRINHIWSTVSTFEVDCEAHAIAAGWDPETTLVLWRPPPTPEERTESAERTRKAIEEDPDWDDIQIGYVPDDQVTGTLYPNMTKERLAEILIKPTKLKVFL